MMNVLEGQRTFKFRESLHTPPCITKQPAHTTFVIHILCVAVGPLELEPASKQHFTTPAG